MRYYIKTYGCQMNEHDSRKIDLLLQSRGEMPAPSAEDADFILFNTCTIRDKAHHKAVSEIGRTALMKQERPGLLVGVCGCVAQQDQEALFDRFPHLDLLFGPDQIGRLPDLLESVRREHRQVAALALVNSAEEYRFLNLVPWGATSPASAFVTIMKGCDSRCAYCIVPKVRGDEVSRPADEIIAEVGALAQQGVREVTLLGQTVNSYGKHRQPDTLPFVELLARIAEATSIERIRFTSPHPKDVNADLVAAYRDNPKLCRHMHMPLQSGSDRILRAMRRAYSRTQYLAKVDALRSACPDIAITTDLMVGFPGEMASDFADTLAMVRDVGYDGMYAFQYSPRPGTESFARMTDDVPGSVKEERLQQLLAMHSKQSRRKLATFVGGVFDVLIEGPSRSEGTASSARASTQCMGRTTHNRIVNVVTTREVIGKVVPVRITRAFSHSLEGEVIDAAGQAMGCSKHE